MTPQQMGHDNYQGRRQDFEWGGALRILTRAKRENNFFSATPQILAPHPKLANKWGANFSLLFFDQ